MKMMRQNVKYNIIANPLFQVKTIRKLTSKDPVRSKVAFELEDMHLALFNREDALGSLKAPLQSEENMMK